MAKDCGYEELGLADLGVMYGLPEFVSLAKDNNIFPILGMDVRCEKYSFVLTSIPYIGLMLFSLAKLANSGIAYMTPKSVIPNSSY